MPGKVHQEQPRAVGGLRGITGPCGAARHRPCAGEHQGMVAAQQQVRRPISHVQAGGAEVQATGHRPRGRVDDLQNTVGHGDDPAAIGLDQVRLVHPGHIVVRAGIRRCRGWRSGGNARPGRRRYRVCHAVHRRGESRKAVRADAGLGRLAQGGELLAAAMKRRQPRWTGLHGNVPMHSPLHRAARTAGNHQQAARHDSSVLTAKASYHAASTATPSGGFRRVGHNLAATPYYPLVPSAPPSRDQRRPVTRPRATSHLPLTDRTSREPQVIRSVTGRSDATRKNRR